ncbi:esterase-like activity of phytase family protein [Aquimarina sp. BL5]|uniref:esterase-like activity of phytase family protein n=1 Tax=Aquimarina sp. BL5 TaxID=1714860 RepID=UPI000E4AB447|nr:esterase-like activity of phytase family protein [Aquimarina sp. BL5]AXT50094.1 esterase-like activity of phytase family protein [Aquimarina sp. BL5]RKN03608.1 esterase-like activity of phytase family protein [Aquimarina sp. BL5]
MLPNIKFVFVVIIALSLIQSCGRISTKNENTINIQYLDEYVIYNDSIFEGSKIGGLSGIEYNKEKNTYYVVCDDAKNPRFYKASITLENNKFNKVAVDQLIKIKDQHNQFLDKNVADLEAIRTFGKDKFIFASEGSIKHNYNPAIFITDAAGNYRKKFQLPSYFLTDSTSVNKPRHNGIFEGLVNDITSKGYWAAMELPLELDGEEPTIDNSGTPVRITHFNINTNQADFQFTYPLDKLSKDPKGKFGVNGVTALQQLTKNQFLIVERGYAAGYGTQGNTVRIYLTNTKDVTNTLDFESLKDKKYQSATKQLLFDFESIRNQLTDQIIDNIEGITFGPILANGNQSLLLISDNNFNPITEQINQLILLELFKNP